MVYHAAEVSMHRWRVAIAIVVLTGLGCSAQRARFDYERVVRDRPAEVATAPAQSTGERLVSTDPSAPAGQGPAPPDLADRFRRIAGRELSLAECIEWALRANPDISAAVARIRQSEAILDEARAPFLPML